MKNYKITVNGVSYDVTVEETGINTSNNNGAAVQTPPEIPPVGVPVKPEGKVSVESPMPGNILEVKTSVGSTVKSGETLLILEAMKMENDIVAPSDGTVASINVNKGDTVDAGQLLLTLN